MSTHKEGNHLVSKDFDRPYSKVSRRAEQSISTVRSVKLDRPYLLSIYFLTEISLQISSLDGGEKREGFRVCPSFWLYPPRGERIKESKTVINFGQHP